jgi:hypothetical protein
VECVDLVRPKGRGSTIPFFGLFLGEGRGGGGREMWLDCGAGCFAAGEIALVGEFYLVMLQSYRSETEHDKTCCALAGAGEEFTDLQNIPLSLSSQFRILPRSGIAFRLRRERTAT